MSWGVPNRSAGGSAQGRRPPAGQRPIWMVVLASLMVVVAFNQFLHGLSVLADGPGGLFGAPAEHPGASQAQQAAALAMQKARSLAAERVDPVLARGYALVKLLMGALMLFAVAAIATNDRRGRRVTLVAAWAAIPYHVAGALFYALVVRGHLIESGAGWVQDLKKLEDGTSGSITSDQTFIMSQFLLAGPVTVALLGIVFSVVLIAFFGGNRGRAFYGLPPRGVPEASGGG